MKKLILILSLICIRQVYAQTYVTIPDTAFVSYLHTIIPSAMNGNQMDTNSMLVTTTTHSIITHGTFTNLFGLQYFKSLTYIDVSQNPNPCMGCTHNSFTTIPTLPNTLLYLDCSGNITSLSSLPTLPNSLQTLYCNFDVHITSLPTLPNSLTSLDCASCNITCFPTFPNSITTLDINSNPYNCLPNYIGCMGTYTTTPLCSAGNSNGCPVAVAGIEHYANNNNNNVLVYPNPSNGTINLMSTNNIDELKITDILGQTVYESRPSSENTTLQIDNSGVYFITITTGKEIITKKVIVNK